MAALLSVTIVILLRSTSFENRLLAFGGVSSSLAAPFCRRCPVYVSRDSWREEADALSSEAATLREAVHALRQYSENDTIDQLLGQASVLYHRRDVWPRVHLITFDSGKRVKLSRASLQVMRPKSNRCSGSRAWCCLQPHSLLRSTFVIRHSTDSGD